MGENTRIHFAESLEALKQIVLRRLPESGSFPTRIDGLTLHRFSDGETLQPRFYDPVLIIVAQGKKRLRIGSQELQYGERSCFIAGVNMPVASCVAEASADSPYLSLSLKLDKGCLASLAARTSPPQESAGSGAGAAVQELGGELLDACLRLLELLDTPEQIPVLGPLVSQEIHYRLLTSPFGHQLRLLHTLGSQSNQIHQAIAWLQENYKESLHIEKLAARLHMAPSTFHKHFKEITTLSPLQYQKRLRLSEARRLLLADRYDVTRAAFAVGYESATQFNREYKRLFGESPRKDVLQIKTAVSGGQLLATG